MKERRDRTGFTLIELLVVVAIIAVLISILLPSLKGARDQAKQLQCNTQMRAMGEASQFYAAEYGDWISRHNDDTYRMHFAASFLINLKTKKRIEDWDGRIFELWDRDRPSRLIDVCREIPQYQCPSHPIQDQPLDYVVSGFPWPYTTVHASGDASGGGRAGDGYRSQTGQHWVNFFKLSSGVGLNGREQQLVPGIPYRLSELVYVTEGHVSLPVNELRFHDLFYTSQLPFGAWPRIGNDKRHPGGINSLFFDGHAKTMTHKTLDSGFGRTIGLRLRFFAPTVEELF